MLPNVFNVGIMIIRSTRLALTYFVKVFSFLNHFVYEVKFATIAALVVMFMGSFTDLV